MDDVERRAIVELSSVRVSCDDCGHFRMIGAIGLKKAADLGLYSYRDLCREIRCADCPKAPPEHRNLSIWPTWRCEEPLLQTSA